MNRYTKRIPIENMRDTKYAFLEFCDFVEEVIRAIGYEVTMVFEDDWEHGERITEATWKPISKTDEVDNG